MSTVGFAISIKLGVMPDKDPHGKVKWSELFPGEFSDRLKATPVVLLPIGLVEPHGQICALGLDLIKAERICLEAAQVSGAIVAPSLSYHIHEVGPSARWLHDEVGQVNPFLGSVGPQAFFHFLLHVLRSYQNAGFRDAILLSGHGGAHAEDLVMVARLFQSVFGLKVDYLTDFDLAAHGFRGDHAGRYEVSLLMYLRPDLVDFDRLPLESCEGGNGKLARNPSSEKATSVYGKEIFDACVSNLSSRISVLGSEKDTSDELPFIELNEVERLWTALCSMPKENFKCLSPRPKQISVPQSSRWRFGEYQQLQFRKGRPLAV